MIEAIKTIANALIELMENIPLPVNMIIVIGFIALIGAIIKNVKSIFK